MEMRAADEVPSGAFVVFTVTFVPTFSMTWVTVAFVMAAGRVPVYAAPFESAIPELAPCGIRERT
jgi:hypothetical protein